MIDGETLVAVLEVTSDVELLLYRTMLQEAGIDVSARRLGDPLVTGDIYRIREPQYELLVRGDDAERARALVEEYRAQVESGKLVDEAEKAADAVDALEEIDEALPAFSSRRWLFTRVLLAVVIVALVLAVIMLAPQLIK